jgi:hypothetical protein
MPITAARVLKSCQCQSSLLNIFGSRSNHVTPDSAIRRSSVEPFRMSVTEGETLDVLFSPVGNWLLARKVAPTSNAYSTSSKHNLIIQATPSLTQIPERVGLVQAYQLALL